MITELNVRIFLARPRGQAAVEVLLVTLVLVAGFWGVGWMRGETGVLAMLVNAVHTWHQKFWALLAVP